MTDGYSTGTCQGSSGAASMEEMKVFMMSKPSFNYSSFMVSDEAFRVIQQKIQKEISDRIWSDAIQSLGVPYSLFGMPVYTFPRSVIKTATCDYEVPVAQVVAVVPRPKPFESVVHGWQIGVILAVGSLILGLLFSVV